jgi:hypothetical protein
MTSFRSVVVRLVALLLGALLLVPALARAAPGCVDVSFYVVYRSGYDHIVHLANHCDRSSTCSVSTNVNPEPTLVGLAPRQELDVLTFRGSPARVFTPRVTCQDAK